MTRIKLTAVTIIAVAAIGAPAGAKGADKRLQAALACAGIAANDERLRCYDAAVATLQQAVQSGALITEPPPIDHPSKLEGIIRSAGGRGFNRFGVTLDNGDRWEIFALSSRDLVPRHGAKVKFKKSPAGGYWYDEPGQPARKARFLGRSAT